MTTTSARYTLESKLVKEASAAALTMTRKAGELADAAHHFTLPDAA